LELTGPIQSAQWPIGSASTESKTLIFLWHYSISLCSPTVSPILLEYSLMMSWWSVCGYVYRCNTDWWWCWCMPL
jgi:hypothetical protein